MTHTAMTAHDLTSDLAVTRTGNTLLKFNFGVSTYNAAAIAVLAFGGVYPPQQQQQLHPWGGYTPPCSKSVLWSSGWGVYPPLCRNNVQLPRGGMPPNAATASRPEGGVYPPPAAAAISEQGGVYLGPTL